MFDTIIFDFDLTLANSVKGILHCFRHTISHFNYEIPDDTAIFNTIGLTLEQAFTVLCKVYDDKKLSQMRAVYGKEADKVMVNLTEFYDGVLDGLKALKDRNFKIGIVSTKYRYRIEDSFKAKGDASLVDVIIGGEDVSSHKPDPSGLELCIKRLNSQKENTIYVGDSYVDAQTAKNAKVSFGGVLTGSTTKEKFQEYDYVILKKNVTELINEILNVH